MKKLFEIAPIHEMLFDKHYKRISIKPMRRGGKRFDLYRALAKAAELRPGIYYCSYSEGEPSHKEFLPNGSCIIYQNLGQEL